MIEKLYTVEEVAELASVTGRTIRNYLKSGRLVGRKIGGQWRFPEAEVQRLLTGAPAEEDAGPSAGYEYDAPAGDTAPEAAHQPPVLTVAPPTTRQAEAPAEEENNHQPALQDAPGVEAEQAPAAVPYTDAYPEVYPGGAQAAFGQPGQPTQPSQSADPAAPPAATKYGQMPAHLQQPDGPRQIGGLPGGTAATAQNSQNVYGQYPGQAGPAGPAGQAGQPGQPGQSGQAAQQGGPQSGQPNPYDPAYTFAGPAAATPPGATAPPAQAAMPAQGGLPASPSSPALPGGYYYGPGAAQAPGQIQPQGQAQSGQPTYAPGPAAPGPAMPGGQNGGWQQPAGQGQAYGSDFTQQAAQQPQPPLAQTIYGMQPPPAPCAENQPPPENAPVSPYSPGGQQQAPVQQQNQPPQQFYPAYNGGGQPGGQQYNAAAYPQQFGVPAQLPTAYPPSPSAGGYAALQQNGQNPIAQQAPAQATQAQPQAPSAPAQAGPNAPAATPPAAPAPAEPAEPEQTEATQPQPQLSEIGNMVTRFISEVHDCANGPQTCAVIDAYQSLSSAKLTSERLNAIAEEESEAGGQLCQAFVEYDERFFVARYSLFGSSPFLLRCLKLIG